MACFLLVVKSHIRIYTKVDVQDIRSHLLLIDDLYGSCAACRHVGINYTRDRVCPNCGTEFHYLATKIKTEAPKILARIDADRLNLKLIDRDDWDHANAKDGLDGLFQKAEP